MENVEAPVVDNSSTQESPVGTAPVMESSNSSSSAQTVNVSSNSWKNNLSTDLRNSPLLNKFEDTPEGLNKALESHANLEKLLGHEKVPIPKDANDVEGWNRFSKAMGIPDKAEGYKLADAQLPESMKGITIDKNKFAEVAHAHKLTPSQTQGLWKIYNEINAETYQKAMADHEKSMGRSI